MKPSIRAAVVWFLATLPLAAAVAAIYVCAEWLFFVTKPSALAALPFREQITVLLRAPGWVILPLLGIQTVASALSIVWFPRWRGVAFVPAAMVGAVLILVLADNFTYTVFGFGVLTTGSVLRIVYATVVAGAAAYVGWTLHAWFEAPRRRIALGIAAAAVIAGPAMARAWPKQAEPLPAPDLAAPPSPAGLTGPLTTWPNVLLIGVDGVTAGETSAYGARPEITPFLARLRDESLFFENAFTNNAKTHGSLVALLTGRLPFTTHVTFPPTVLQGDDSRRHLPNLLKKLGYTTLQIGMRHYADAEDANLIGFDAANYRWQRVEDVKPADEADETELFMRQVADRASERVGQLFGFRYQWDSFAQVQGKKSTFYWSDTRRVETLARYFRAASQPWFVHAHLLDTHCCHYYPRATYFPEENWYANARHSILRETDQRLQHLFEVLQETGLLERTIIVITSDHTNEWQTTGRVPLMMRFPNAEPRGSVPLNAQLVDVAPTLLAYLQQPRPDWMDGESLLDWRRLPRSRPIFAVAELEKREADEFRLTRIPNAGPPNYGAKSATLVAGAKWFELSLDDGSLKSGAVEGHTLPNEPDLA